VDHLLRMQEHYSRVGASQQAGAATYFGFLSIFPILALAFFVVGWIARVYPDARHALHQAINDVLPGLIGSGHGQISLAEVQHAAGAAGLFGLVGVLYSGLGWLSSLQSALLVVFETPARERPNFLIGKVRDLATLVVLGTVLLVAVAVTGFVRGFSADVLRWLGLSAQLGWLLTVLTVLLGLVANAVLFVAIFTLLARPDLRPRALWQGAALGAVGFEVLKQLSGVLLAATRGKPGFQAFGISLILLVWINYFSRLTMYAAAYALTAQPEAQLAAAPVQGPSTPALEVTPPPGPSPVGPFVAGAATMAGLTGLFAIWRRKK
jgi:membrane protein